MKHIFKKNKKFVLLTILFCIIDALMNVYASFYMTNVFNGLKDGNIKKMLFTSLTILLLYLIAGFTTYLKSIIQSKTVKKLINTLRNSISNNISRIGFEDFYQKDSGNYVSWFINDVSQIEQQIFNNIFSMILSIFASLFSFIALIKLNKILAPVAIALFFVMYIVPKLATKNIQKYSMKRSKSLEIFIERTKEILMGFDIYYTFNKFDKFTKDISNYSNEIENENYNYKKNMAKINFQISMAHMISQMLLILTTVYLVFIGEVSEGAVVSVAGVGGAFFSGVISVINSIVAIKSAKPIIEKLQLDEHENEILHAQSSEINSIETKNLSYQFNNGKMISYPDLKFESGKKYLINGISGSGKSTLFKILMGLFNNYTGNIFINGFKKPKSNSFNSNISYIPQNTYLFNCTLKENLTLGSKCSDDEINKAIEIAELTDYVNENGLNTVITENGKNLSGGQRQRIAIARAILKNSKFIFIDEATSALDSETAMKVETNLMKLKELSLIFITHNPRETLIKSMDKIYSI